MLSLKCSGLSLEGDCEGEKNNLNFLRRKLWHCPSRTLQEFPCDLGMQPWASLCDVCFSRVVKPRFGRLSKLNLSHSHPDPVLVMVLFPAGG